MGKITKVFSMRLDEEEIEYLNDISNLLSLKPAEYVRMLIDSSMVKYRVEKRELNEYKEES